MVAKNVVRHQSFWRHTRLLLGGLISFALSSSVFANPVVDNVANGNIDIQQTATTTTVNQASQKGIVNWKSFNIGAGEHTHFNQPAGGVTLNRISPNQGASQIWGQLSATGRIILVNPAGVFIGPNAFINVGSMIASTRDITDQNFLNGIYRFDQFSNFNGAIVNQGTIVAANHGLVALVGGAVSNEGVIQANLGKVVLASGEQFTMSFAGNDMISFAVDEGITQRAVDMNGNELADGVKNTGSIIADGGQILVHAKAAQGVLDNVINMEGYVQANSVQEVNGEIILMADNATENIVRVAGTMNAIGDDAGETGGDIKVLGYNLLLDQNALLDASGDAGGGKVRIGGNNKGLGPLPNANAVLMAPDAQIYADAITNGNGGEVILWGNLLNRTYGSIYARGGTLGGNGGYVETSAENIDVGNAYISTVAPNGNFGIWLLDPVNVEIIAGTQGGLPGAVNDWYTWNGYTGFSTNPTDGSPAYFYVTDIQNKLATNNVVLYTTGSGGTVNCSTNSTTLCGWIKVNAAITWAENTALAFDSYGTSGSWIEVNANITGTGTTSRVEFWGSDVYLNGSTSTTIQAGSVWIEKNLFLRDGGKYETAGAARNLFITTNSTGTTSSIDGQITGSGYIYKQGAGTLVLYSTSNDFTGGIQINGGTVTSGNNNVLPDAGSIFIVNGTLNLNGYSDTVDYVDSSNSCTTSSCVINVGSGNLSFGSATDSKSYYGNITGSGSGYIYKKGNTYLNLYGTITAPKLYISDGEIRLLSNNHIGDSTQVYINGGTLSLSTFSDTVGLVTFTGGGISGSGTLTTTGGFDFNFASGTVNVNVVLAGTGMALTKSGNGTLVLQAPNTYTGTTNINGGTLRYDQGNDRLAGGNISIGGGTLDLQTYSDSVGAVTISSGSIIGSGTLTGTIYSIINTSGTVTISAKLGGTNVTLSKLGDGTLSLSGANTYTGLTTVSAGTLALGASNVISSGGVTVSGGTLDIGVNSDTVGAVTLSGGTITGTSGVLTGSSYTLSSGTISGKLGGSAAINISGYVTLGASDVLPSNALNITSGTFLLGDNSDTVGAIAILGGAITGNTGVLTGSSYAITNSTGTVILSGKLGTGNVTKSGAGTFALGASDVLDNSSTLTVSSGIFDIGNYSDTVSTVNLTGGTITGGTGVLTATSYALDYGTISVALGAGDITKTTVGTLTLGASSIFDDSSALTISNGTFSIGPYSDTVGTITLSGGALTGSSGTLTGSSYNITSSTGITATLSAKLGTGTINQSGAGTFALGASNLFSNGNAVNISNGAFNIDTYDANVGAVTLSGGNITGTTGTLTGASYAITNTSGTSTITAKLAGSGISLTKSNAGTLVLSGTNTYTGATTINGGTLQLGQSNVIDDSSNVVLADTSLAVLDLASYNETIGSLSGGGANGGNITLGTGTLTLANNTASYTSTYSGAISDAGHLTINLTGTGTNIFTLAGSNAYTGTTTITAGTLQLGASNVLADTSDVSLADAATAIFDLNGNSDTVGSLSGGGVNGGNITLGSGTLAVTQSSDVTYYGIISGTNGNFTKKGNNQLTFANAQTYTGTTQIDAGTLSFSGSGDLADSSSLNVNGGTFDLSTLSQTLGNVTLTDGSIINGTLTGSSFTVKNGSISAALAGNGVTLTKDTSGTVTFSNVNTYTGVTTISDGILTLGIDNAIAGDVTVSSTGAFDINSHSESIDYVTLTGGSITGTTGTLTSTNDFDVQSGNISTKLAGAVGLNKTTSGTVTLSGANSYSGSTSVTAGTLTLGADNVIVGNVTVNSTGVFDINSHADTVGDVTLLSGSITGTTGTLTGTSYSLTNSGTITAILGGSGISLTKTGSGTVTLSGTNTYTGDTNVIGGILQLGNDDVITNTGSVNVLGGTLDISSRSDTIDNLTVSSGSITGTTGTLTSTNGYTFTNSGTVSAKLGGTAGLTKSGSGTVTLSGANTYSGLTSVSAGTLALGADNVIAADVTVSGTGTFNISSFSDTVGIVTLTGGSIAGTTGALSTNSDFDVRSGSISAKLGGSVGLNKSTSGIVTLSGANTYTGATTVSAGTLQLGADNVIAGDVTVSSTGIFDINSHSDTVGDVTLLNGSITGTTGTLTASSYSLTNTGSITAILGGSGISLTKTGSGTVTLSGANTYTGDTNIMGGILQLGNDNIIANASTINVMGGTFDINSRLDTVDNVNLSSGSITGTTGTLTSTNGYTFTNSGSVSAKLGGTAGLTKSGSGTVTLSGANTYSGVTTVSAGTLALGANDVIAGDVTVSGTGAFNISSYSDTVGTVALTGGSIIGTSGTLSSTNDFDVQSGSISAILGGSHGLNKTTSGTVTLSGSNTYIGTTSITGGILSISSNSHLGNTSSAVTINSGELQATNSFTTNRAITIGSSGATVSVTSGNTLTIGTTASITGNGLLTKAGVGDILIQSSNDYSAGTSITQGTMRVASNVQALGSGGIAITSGAALQVESINISNAITLEGSGISSQGALIGTGNAIISGTLNLLNATTVGTNSNVSNALTITTPINNAIALTTTGNGTVIFNNTVNLTSLTANSNVQLGGASVTTTDAQNYSAKLTLGHDVTLTGAGVTLNTVVTDQSVSGLTVATNSSALVLNGDIGSLAIPLSSFTASNSGATNDISFANDIFTNGNISVTAGRNVTLSTGNLNSSTGNVSLTATAGSVSDSGTGSISGGLLTVGSATGISLAAGHSLSGIHATISGSGNLSFTNSGTLNIAEMSIGSNNATINNTGAITQSGVITANNATFSVGANSINLGLNNAISGTVAFTNSGNNNLTLNNIANTLTVGISNVGSGVLSISNTGNMVVSNTVTSSGGNINLTTLKPDSNERTLTVNAGINSNGGEILLTAANNAVGDATPLVINATLNSGAGSGGTLTLSGGSALNVTPAVGTGNITLNGNGLDLTFGTINFDFNIGFLAARKITLTGAFTTSNNASMTLTANGTGNGEGIVIDSGASIISAGSLTLNGKSTLGGNLTTAGGNITVNGAATLTQNIIVNATTGNITFADAVTGSGKSLTLQNNTAAGGTVTFNGNVNVGDFVTYAQPYQVILNGATNTFASHVNFSNTNGVRLGNSISDTFTFSSGFNSTSSTTTINSAITGGTVALSAVNLTGNSSVNAGIGTVNVSGNITGLYALTLESSNGVTLSNVVNVGSLTLSGGGSDVINTHTITTTGAQSYQNAVTLNNVTSNFSGTSVNFGNSLTASVTNLNVSASAITFGGNVYAQTVTASGGLINFGGARVETSGNQQYTGRMSANGTLLVATNTSEVNQLTLNTGGSQTWGITGDTTGTLSGSAINGSLQFANMRMLNGGSVNLNNTIDVTAYNSPVTLETQTSYAGRITSDTGMNISFSNMKSVVLNPNNANIALLSRNGGNILYVDNNYSGYTGTGVAYNNIKKFIAYGSNNTVYYLAATVNNTERPNAFVTGNLMEFVGFSSFKGNYVTPQQVADILTQTTVEVYQQSSFSNIIQRPIITPQIDIISAVIAITNQLDELKLSVSPDNTEGLTLLVE